MDACMPCFGGKRRQGTSEDRDRDPLLPKYASSQQPQTGQPSQTLNANFLKGRNGRIIDLESADSGEGSSSGGAGQRPSFNAKESPPSPLPLLGKLVDVVAAFQAGKLPSQDQVSRLLQLALSSEFLKEGPARSGRDAAFMYGSGPSSVRGQKALNDLRNVLQSALEFSMEKNDDNKIQDLFYQLSQTGSDDLGVDFEFEASNLKSSRAAEALESVFNTGQQSASNVKHKVPVTSEITSDTAVLVHALRTLLQSALTSTIFRFLVVDGFNILRDLAIHGISDIGSAAFQVHEAARDIEKKLSEADVGEKVNQAMEGIQNSTSGQFSEKGKEVVDSISSGAGEAKGKVSEKADEWRDHGARAMDEVRDNFIARIQQILVRVQEDPASRSAVHAILILVRKYADMAVETSDAVLGAAEKVVEQVVSATENVTPSRFSQPKSQGTWQPPSTYPPPTNLYPPVTNEKQGTFRLTSQFLPKDDISALNVAFLDLKVLLERIGRGHSLDRLLRALVDVMKDVNVLPIEVEGAVAKEMDYFGSDAKGKTKEGTPAGQSRKGNSSRKKKRKGKKVSSEPTTPLEGTGGTATPATPQSTIGQDTPKKANVLGAYFFRLGRYLDRALVEPGWVTSRKGTKELESLFNEGIHIINAVGGAALEVGTTVLEGALEADEQTTNQTANDRGRNQEAVSKESEAHALQIRRQFKTHISLLWTELEAYVAAVEKDRSTMKLIRSLNTFAHSVSDLLSSGPGISSHHRSKSQSQKYSANLPNRIRSSFRWTEWVGWALPRLIHLIPLDALPIPSLEARSESGGWEAGLYALFVKGEAAKKRDKKSLGAGKDDGDHVTGGIQTTLIPNEIVFKEWTEVRIDMSDVGGVSTRPSLAATGRSYSRHSLGRDHHIMSRRPVIEGLMESTTHLHSARVDTTSRIHMHVDGMRAKVDGLGYYFRYGGPDAWFGYEDEGIINVDIGMGSPHAGLGGDIEIEISSECSPSKYPSSHKRKHQPDEPPPTALVEEGIEGEGDMVTIPEYSIEEPGSDVPAVGMGTAIIVEGEIRDDEIGGVGGRDDEPTNLDIQRAIDTGSIGREREEMASKLTGLPYSSFRHHHQPLEPLFRVVDVDVQMKGVQVVLEKSRHCILNKLVIQPLAGPAVHELVKRALETRIKESLDDVALELARLARDAQAHAETRREKTRRRRIQERKRRIKRLIEQGHLDADPDVADLHEEEEEGLSEMIEDWAHAVTQGGSRMLQKRTEDSVEEEDVRTQTGLDATMRGLVYQSSQVRVESDTDRVAPVVFNKHTRQMEPVKEELAGVSGVEERSTDKADITVAIGGGAQLFPDKEVPYGQRNDASGQGQEGEGLLDRAADAVRAKADKAKGVAKDTVMLKDQVESRYKEDLRRERRAGWKSNAFDL